MPNPTPLYRVKWAGQYLPGYVQAQDINFTKRVIDQTILNRNGGILGDAGAETKQISVVMRYLTRLGDASGLDHLNDCIAQHREAMAILGGNTGIQPLVLGDETRYHNAVFAGATQPLQAGESRRLTTTLTFSAEPFTVDSTEVSGSFSGNGTVNITLPATSTTYPVFTVPSGVTAFIATHASGKAVNFLRGLFTGTITIDCSNFHVVTDAGVNASATMQNVNFGIAHTTGAGTFSVTISGMAGSGSVGVDIAPRYEY